MTKDNKMGKNKDKTDRVGIIRTIVLLTAMLVPGMAVDMFYRLAAGWWRTWKIVSWLESCNITYNNAFGILGGSFGVIISMVSMFLTINNNISERLEKKVYGIPRSRLYEEQHTFANGLFKYLKRMCLCAPVLMMVLLNLKFCVGGYLVFVYCISFLLWHYHRYDRSYSRELAFKKTIDVLMKDLPKEGTWTLDTTFNYQVLLENIGKSVEEEGNWKDTENLYYGLIDAVREYDYEKRYYIIFNFYRMVFWRKEKEGRTFPMDMLLAYLDSLDMELAKAGTNIIKEKYQLVLWAMMRAAVCEAREEELIRFFEKFYDFLGRSRRILEKTGQAALPLKIMEEEAGMLLVLLEYRFRRVMPANMHFVRWLKRVWECGNRCFKFRKDKLQDNNAEGGYECPIWMSGLIGSSFEDDRQALETILANINEDCSSGSTKSVIINIILEMGA